MMVLVLAMDARSTYYYEIRAEHETMNAIPYLEFHGKVIDVWYSNRTHEV